MAEPPLTDEQDKDALHILPLAMVPLQTPGLAKAKLVKNSRLEGMVELFSGKETGSGQVPPDELMRVFHFDDSNRDDLDLIRTLGELPSFDVYSLRVELRRLGIPVDHFEHLRLSQSKTNQVAAYMAVFTRPLVQTVYGRDKCDVRSLDDILKLFADPDVETARRNLLKLAKSLDIGLASIPAFLADYGDVYLSLAYYQYCLDQNKPKLQAFESALADIRGDKQLKANGNLQRMCQVLERKLNLTNDEVTNILEIFRSRTEHMWENPTGINFREMQDMITGYQSRIGGALCALTVKMNAWAAKFPSRSAGTPSRRADFGLSDILPGIEMIEAINYSTDALPGGGATRAAG